MSEPLVLGFDTSAAHCAAALLRGDEVIASEYRPMAKGQVENLMPLLERVLATEGLVWGELDAIGVGVGPGNFTGIRISVSAARGLSLALDIPAIGVSTFEVAYEATPIELMSSRTQKRAKNRNLSQTIYLVGPRVTAYAQKFRNDVPLGVPWQEPADPDGCGPYYATEVDWQGEGIMHLTRLAARKLLSGAEHSAPKPMYVRPADAAPARDTAPVMLDDDA